MNNPEQEIHKILVAISKGDSVEALEPVILNILTASNREAVAKKLRDMEELVKPEYHGVLVGMIKELEK